MIDKREYIHSLKNIKLVLGNGYDLHCKLHSSYKDYLYKRKEYFDELRNLITKYKEQFNNCASFLDNTTFDDIELSKVNIWEMVLAVMSYYSVDDKCWFNVEEEMQRSLDDNPSSIGISFPATLNSIQNKIKNGSFYADMFASFFIKKYGLKEIYQSSKFYDTLLDELIEFENSFGEFIHNQRVNTKNHWFLIGMENDKFLKCAQKTIDDLCDKHNVISVDNFNYDDCGISEFKEIERNINGDVSAPIFGVDSIYAPLDPRIVFTKTHRRMTADMEEDRTLYESKFDNLIIYGHSLDKADYSYFFPVFDKIQLTNNLERGVVVFAFTIYDKKIENEIKMTLNKSIYRLFEAYAIYKGYSKNEANRLLDYLSIQKRIVMYEIPEITEPNLTYKTHFDYYWEDKKR